jgi:hypothetical protein
MLPEDGGPIPGFPDDVLDYTLASSYGVGADAGLPDQVRFLVGAVRAIRSRLRESAEAPESMPTLFLLAKKSDVSPPPAEFRTVHLMDQGRTTLASHVWFVNAPVLRGDGLQISEWDSESLITDIAATWGAGHVPAVFFDPTTERPQIRFYPGGLQDTDNCDVRFIDDRRVRMDEILAIVDAIHDRFLRTATGQSRSVKLWENPDKHIPKREAEDLVQHHLRVGLTGALPHCIVREEQPSPVGRLDLKIEDRSPRTDGGIVPHAILELKVIRSFSSGGTSIAPGWNAAWIACGVRQADSYRREWSALAAALCCFDMRVKPVGDAMFTDAVRKEASSLEVQLRAWDMYPSPAAGREAPLERS